MNVRTIPVVFCFLILVASCKKSSNNNPFGNVKIATADVTHAGAVEHYLFYYDAYNNLDSVSIIGGGSAAGHAGYLKYSYVGSSYTITDENNFSFMVYANTGGNILKVLIPDTLTYIYTNSQLSEINEYAPSATPPYYTNTPAYYTWLNGDVTTIVTGSQTQAYTYNTGKNGQPGDAIRITGFLDLGRSAIKTTHLPASLTLSSTRGVNYLYTFDSKGRISTLTEVAYDNTASSHDTTSYAYTYY